MKTAFRRLTDEFRPYRAQLGVIFGLGLIISAIQPATVKISQQIIDGLQQKTDPAIFRWVPALLILVFAVSGLAKYFHNSIRRKLTEQVLQKLRSSLFRKFLLLPLRVVDRRKTGEMLASIQNDLSLIGSGIDTFCDLLKEPFTFLGLMGVAFYCDWRLSMATLLVAPLVAFSFSRSGSAVKRYSAKNLEYFAELMSLSQESLVGSRVIKVFRLEAVLLDKFRRIHDSYFKTIWKSIQVQELATPIVELIGAVLMAVVVYYGSYRIAAGELTAGGLVAFIIALGLAQMPIKQLNNAFLKIRAAEAAAERVYELLDVADSGLLRSGTTRKTEFVDKIEFRNVCLSYEEKVALDGISFEVRAGECIALVGHSGSGKTSLVNLLPRLYEVTRGNITIDGTDIRDIFLADLRGLISFVTQDTFLFNDTILENIRYGRPEASDSEVARAAELAHCLEFIEKSPKGFFTRIGDRGLCLSGGERQRVAIARAILKGSPILVLDEATSSLDSHSEQMVQSALDELMHDKTTFLVAHRFSTVRRADKIFVLEDGRVKENGTHENLLGQGGIYTGLFEIQASMGKDLNII